MLLTSVARIIIYRGNITIDIKINNVLAKHDIKICMLNCPFKINYYFNANFLINYYILVLLKYTE